MAVTARRDRYTVDLIGLQAACEANFARLMRLLPDMREQPSARRIAVTQATTIPGHAAQILWLSLYLFTEKYVHMAFCIQPTTTFAAMLYV